MEYCTRGKEVLDVEIASLENLKEELNDNFDLFVMRLAKVAGKIVFMGVGKSGDICRKITATMSSLGIPSYYLDSTEAIHGSLGMVEKDDAVVMISNSGNTEELVKIVPNIKMLGCMLFVITQNKQSNLYILADVTYLLPKMTEADKFHLAPTTSTTVMLALGDALAVVLSEHKGFRKEQFGFNHPGGMLGKKLLTRVRDIMHTENEIPIVSENDTLKTAIVEIGNKKMGAAIVANDDNKLVGMITSGDLRRVMEKQVNIYSVFVGEVMNQTPIAVEQNELVTNVLLLMKREGIRVSTIPVITEGKGIVGIINSNDILQLGIYC